MTTIHEYAFDVKLYAAIRVKASSLPEAIDILKDHGQCMSCNGGHWHNGDPILFEASVDNADDIVLYEFDGEPV